MWPTIDEARYSDLYLPTISDIDFYLASEAILGLVIVAL